MNTENDIEKLAKLVKGINIAMLTTADTDGTLHSRPMATQSVEFDGTLWFFTEASAGKGFEIRADQNVNVSYADPSGNRYISVSGTAQIVRDQAKAKELWSPAHKAWFPKGPEDPSLALLKVNVTRAEFWDGPSSKLVQLYGFAKAILTGKKYEGEGTDHDKLNLEHATTH